MAIEIAQTVETASRNTTMARALRWLPMLLLLLLFCSCAQSSPLSTMTPTTERWFTQKLDHFDQKDLSFWRQRYFINDAFYKPGGPVFLMIGGMETAKRNWISRNLPFIAYAERLHALCLVLEHRFYGHSQPTGDLSTASLRYIRNHQVLGDIVNFRIKIAKLMGLTKNKWVAFGEFYGGSLAVWSRIKYPDLFAAAVGSSAPVKVKINFDEYFEGVQTSLDASNIKCSRAVQRALLEVIRMLKSPKSYSILKSDFMLCETPQNKSSQHIPFVLENLMSFLIPIVQYNKKRKSVMNILSIDDFCDKMTETPLSSPYHRYARIVRNNIRNRNLSCLDANYNHRLRRLSETSLDKGNVDQARQRLYQCCTEFGFFQSTDSRYQPFSELPIRYFLDKCSDLFGSEYSFSSLRQSAEALNSYYGGFNVNGSKIIFSSGSLDPWNALGITRDISKNLRAVLIEGESHCADMEEKMDSDSAELIQAREKIFRILKKWLKK